MSLLLLFRGEGDYTPPVTDVGFTQPKDVIVRLQALDGSWETCGADRARGVTPEDVQLVSDQWGSKTASFSLRRDPKAIWPDIGAFAPVEVEVGGRLVWSGRVSETPVRDSTDSVISVQCEGWQAHLDDDLYERVYVHTDLGEWTDARSSPDADLSAWLASGSVEAGDGNIVIGYANGAKVDLNQRVGAVLDLGAYSTAKRVVISWSNEGIAAGSYKLRCRAFPSMADFTFSGQTIIDVEPATASSPQAATITTPYRYVAIYLSRVAASGTEAADRKVRVTAAQVFADTAYESSNASVLKADQVVKDALDRATLMLSSDQSRVAAGTFSIPELAPGEPRTPREMWDAVNAFEDYQAAVDVLKRPVFRAKPTSPEVEVGAWSGMEFEDSSANSGDEIYQRVIVTGTKADGTPLRVMKSQGESSPTTPVAIPSSMNTSFATNTSGWTASGLYGATSTITRDTATFDTSPASGRWDLTGASDALNGTATLSVEIPGTFVVGRTYMIQVAMKSSTATSSQVNLGFGVLDGMLTGGAGDYKVRNLTFNNTSWGVSSCVWSPSKTLTSGVGLALAEITYPGPVGYYWVDSVALFASNATVVERRGFTRCKAIASSFKLTTAAAGQIASKWLQSHKTSPFKGRAKLTGNQAVRDIKTGRNVPAEELLLRTGELIRFSDRIDPDTGAAGRDGRLVEAQYNANDDTTDITIDSSRAGFEALLERLGVVLGQNRFS